MIPEAIGREKIEEKDDDDTRVDSSKHTMKIMTEYRNKKNNNGHCLDYKNI